MLHLLLDLYSGRSRALRLIATEMGSKQAGPNSRETEDVGQIAATSVAWIAAGN